jgi:hypothetical protein
VRYGYEIKGKTKEGQRQQHAVFLGEERDKAYVAAVITKKPPSLTSRTTG